MENRCYTYNEIAEMCRKTAEPVFLTKNGEGNLVIMDIETYNRREKMLKLREKLLAVEEDRMHGSKDYSVDEVAAMMRSVIKEAANHRRYRLCGLCGGLQTGLRMAHSLTTEYKDGVDGFWTVAQAAPFTVTIQGRS